MTLHERLRSPGPKRILALDGGGIRGALTLGFLEKLEALLRQRHNNPKLLLCDYFDLIGGTSTGSIIATLLAVGKDTAFIKKMYLELGGEIFAHKKGIFGMLSAKFKEDALRAQLKEHLADRPFGDKTLKTGLGIVAKRADTGGTWPLVNHPDIPYFDRNKNIPLRNVVRASTAAPTYFLPEKINVGGGEEGAFVDGGVSMANNPALQLFLIATLPAYKINWATGADNLLVVSVGTGATRSRFNIEDVLDNKLWDWASAVPNMLMYDANMQNQLILQTLSRSPHAQKIDRALGTSVGGLLPEDKALLHYLRYDAPLNEEVMKEIGMPKPAAEIEKLREMSDAANRFALAEIGEKAAAAYVKGEHLPAAFDL